MSKGIVLALLLTGSAIAEFQSLECCDLPCCDVTNTQAIALDDPGCDIMCCKK